MARAIDLYASSASDEDVVPLKPHRKHTWSSPSPKASLKPSGAVPVKGTIVQSIYFSFMEGCDIDFC
jgi:hypothetical protein